MTNGPARKSLTATEREELEDVFDRMMRGEGPQELAGTLGVKVKAMLEELKRLHPLSDTPIELSPETEEWLANYIDSQAEHEPKPH